MEKFWGENDYSTSSNLTAVPPRPKVTVEH